MYGFTAAVICAAILHVASSANCNGGTAGAGSRPPFVYNATRTITSTEGKPERCDYNLSKSVDIVIDKVEITGEFQCVAGGPGDFNVGIIVQEGKSFHGLIWASGKDVGRIVNPTNSYSFPCSVDLFDKCP